MWSYTQDEVQWLETPRFQAERDGIAKISKTEVDHYIDVARRMRAAAIADLFRKATTVVARSLHLNPASRGATPRTV